MGQKKTAGLRDIVYCACENHPEGIQSDSRRSLDSYQSPDPLEYRERNKETRPSLKNDVLLVTILEKPGSVMRMVESSKTTRQDRAHIRGRFL